MSYPDQRPGSVLCWQPDNIQHGGDALMILTSYNDQSLEVRPHTFDGLMDLYERNYIRIRRLIPHMPAAGEETISALPDALDLHLHVLERFRYTTELHLSYRFERADGIALEPDLLIRVYHDARQAEVTAARLRHWPEFQGEAQPPQPTLQSRWHVNRFLYKWLNYCLYQGHSFAHYRPDEPQI